jgi:hypothetical protein
MAVSSSMRIVVAGARAARAAHENPRRPQKAARGKGRVVVAREAAGTGIELRRYGFPFEISLSHHSSEKISLKSIALATPASGTGSVAILSFQRLTKT